MKSWFTTTLKSSPLIEARTGAEDKFQNISAPARIRRPPAALHLMPPRGVGICFFVPSASKTIT